MRSGETQSETLKRDCVLGNVEFALVAFATGYKTAN